LVLYEGTSSTVIDAIPNVLQTLVTGSSGTVTFTDVPPSTPVCVVQTLSGAPVTSTGQCAFQFPVSTVYTTSTSTPTPTPTTTPVATPTPTAKPTTTPVPSPTPTATPASFSTQFGIDPAGTNIGLGNLGAYDLLLGYPSSNSNGNVVTVTGTAGSTTCAVGTVCLTLTFTFPTNAAQTAVQFNGGATWQIESSLLVVGGVYTQTVSRGGSSTATATSGSPGTFLTLTSPFSGISIPVPGTVTVSVTRNS
jgi:hypothetical protein